MGFKQSVEPNHWHQQLCLFLAELEKATGLQVGFMFRLAAADCLISLCVGTATPYMSLAEGNTLAKQLLHLRLLQSSRISPRQASPGRSWTKLQMC